jgi:hypothetical protein
MAIWDVKDPLRVTDVVSRIEAQAQAVLGDEASEPLQKADARTVLEYCREVRMWIRGLDTDLEACGSYGSGDALAVDAIRLGYVFAMMEARDSERKVVQHNRATRKLRASAAERATSPETIAKALRLHGRLRKQNPDWKLGKVDAEVAKRFRVTDRTVRNWRRRSK